MVAIGFIFAAAAQAQLPDNVDNVVKEAKLASGELTANISKIINAVLGLVSAIAVIALIYGGIKYITSLGNEDEAAKAKRVILYAIIGLIVIALSAVIVNFVLSKVKGGGGV